MHDHSTTCGLVTGIAGQPWIGHGRIFEPPTHLDWMKTHVAVPVVLHLRDDRYRVFFSGRDERNRSHTGYFDWSIDEPHRVRRVSERAILAPGPIGSFDEDGAMATWLVPHEGRLYLYYIGWNRGATVPFRNAIGLAISTDGGSTFEKVGPGPIIDRSIHDPCFTASCCVLIDRGVWRMWYLSCVAWERVGGKPRHRYHIKYAESDNGIDWRRDGKVCIDFLSHDEYAISRPSVMVDHDRYRMWYSYRGRRYRIGYAESGDGLQWTRLDDLVGIDTSVQGWDSEMIEYPCVFDHGTARYMLYNGNDYGRTGIGLSIMDRTAT